MRVLVVGLAAALLPVAASAADGFRVVANESVPVSSLSRTELARIFLKKQIEWPDGESAVPVDQSSISLVRTAFTQTVHEKKMSAITSHWQKQIFSGRGVPPPVRGSDDEVIAFDRSTPGANGYVAADTPATGVKTIRVE
jgi:ABC-type phosphate transport system substrate-binding protein